MPMTSTESTSRNQSLLCRTLTELRRWVPNSWHLPELVRQQSRSTMILRGVYWVVIPRRDGCITRLCATLLRRLIQLLPGLIAPDYRSLDGRLTARPDSSACFPESPPVEPGLLVHPPLPDAPFVVPRHLPTPTGRPCFTADHRYYHPSILIVQPALRGCNGQSESATDRCNKQLPAWTASVV